VGGIFYEDETKERSKFKNVFILISILFSNNVSIKGVGDNTSIIVVSC
jgi:hypothetical protein